MHVLTFTHILTCAHRNECTFFTLPFYINAQMYMYCICDPYIESQLDILLSQINAKWSSDYSGDIFINFNNKEFKRKGSMILLTFHAQTVWVSFCCIKLLLFTMKTLIPTRFFFVNSLYINIHYCFDILLWPPNLFYIVTYYVIVNTLFYIFLYINLSYIHIKHTFLAFCDKQATPFQNLL